MFFPLPSLRRMFLAFGSLPPCVLIVLMPTILVLTFVRAVAFNPPRLRFRLVLLILSLIYPPSIVEFHLFSQLELPSPTKNRSPVCTWNWNHFYPPFRSPSLLFLLPLKMSLDFLCGRIPRERPRFTCLTVLISALVPNWSVAAPLDWPPVRSITLLENCVPSLTPLADRATGRGYSRGTLRLISPLKNTLFLSPKNKHRQEFLLARPYPSSSTSLLSCVPTCVTERFFPPYLL